MFSQAIYPKRSYNESGQIVSYILRRTIALSYYARSIRCTYESTAMHLGGICRYVFILIMLFNQNKENFICNKG